MNKHTYAYHSDLLFSFLVLSQNKKQTCSYPGASVIRCQVSACHDHAQSYNKPAMMLLAYFLMSCAVQLKMMTGDLQLNTKITHSLETTFWYYLIGGLWHP